MGLFSRRNRPDSRPMAAAAAGAGYDREYEPWEHQSMAIALVDAFDAYDQAVLAALTPAQRAEQLEARWTLYQYVDAIWEDAKDRGLDPAVRPEWNVIAGLRDLTGALFEQVNQARADAGDED
jgi:hypothetical protein